MSAASYNRGSRVVSRDADAQARVASTREDRRAQRDEAERLRERIAELERELARARRCVAELRRSKDERLREARNDQRRSDLAISILCKMAFRD